MQVSFKPEILAPAGSKASFLAALAAGADAVYCGMKQFSARMEAKNFSLADLSSLTRLAHEKGTRVYIAFNTLIKPGEIEDAGRRLFQLNRDVGPDALIVQDPALPALARKIGYKGEVHLSTLANVSFGKAVEFVGGALGVDRVVLPRELHVDEIKTLAKMCPTGLSLEVFTHGALCYGVSGRCYWSSYLGGRSSLRGRCVQPCRRRYSSGPAAKRYFSCQDLSLDVLVKVLMGIPEVKTWKIEGRKKGPHYVYYTVQAYKMLRDQGSDPKIKKAALELLSRALGRANTHFNFLPQRPQNPVNVNGQTGSGLLVGRLQGATNKPYIVTRDALLKNDVLRIGYEDDRWHAVRKVTRFTPKKGRLHLKVAAGRREMKGTPVFLIDRKEKYLEQKIAALEQEMTAFTEPKKRDTRFQIRLPRPPKRRVSPFEMHLSRGKDEKTGQGVRAVWLTEATVKGVAGRKKDRTWWWLPPVIWPETEAETLALVGRAIKRGARNFVLNAPWQMAMMGASKRLNVWAGPFCNIANPLAVDTLKSMGFSGVVVSPELGREDIVGLPESSPLPLGIVIEGNWPLCISRFISDQIEDNRSFTSPKGEQAWTVKHEHAYWIYPNWRLDITSQKDLIRRAGYTLFISMHEPVPRGVKMKSRQGMWNWKVGLR